MKLSYKKITFVIYLVYCCALGADRLLSGAGYILLGLASLILLTQFNLKYRNFYIFSLILLFVYAALSYFGYLNNPWGRYYSDSDLARQIMIYLVFILVIAASSIIFYNKNIEEYNITGTKVLIAYSLSALSEYFFIYIYREDSPANPLFIGGLNNAEFLFLALLGAWIMRGRLNFFLLFATITLGPLISANSQGYIVFFFLAILSIFSNRKIVTISYLVGLSSFTIFCIYNPFSFQDYNTVIRALYWRDAVNTIFNHQLYQGVGFGGEWIKNWYIDAPKVEMFVDGTPEMIHTGLHNSIVSIFFRMGFPGLILIGAAIFVLAKKSFNCKFKNYLFLMTITSAWVNVALESPLFNIAIAIAWGYILTAKPYKRHCLSDKT
jgi:hypothetical protein